MRKPSTDQILEWKERRGPSSGPAYDILSRIDDLSRAWKASPDSNLVEFIPMRITTCIEVYVREIVRELVDSGGPRIARAESLAKNAKLDLIFAANITGQKLSVGDFVAHAVSINSIESVLASLSGLIQDFDTKLKNSHPRWSEERESWPMSPIIVNYGKTIGTLNRLFTIRHVLTHELPKDPIVNDDDIDQFCEAAHLFVDACDWVVVEELHGSVAQTQTEMNIQAGHSLESGLQELKEVLDLAKQTQHLDATLLDEAQTNWEEFADTEACLVASKFEGGSIYPMIWSSAKADLVQDRVSQLRQLIENWME